MASLALLAGIPLLIASHRKTQEWSDALNRQQSK